MVIQTVAPGTSDAPRARGCTAPGRCSASLRPPHARTIVRRLAFRRRGQIIAPCGRRDLLPSVELPRGLKALALRDLHRRLPSDVAPTHPGGPYRPRAASGRMMASRPSVTALLSQETVIVCVSLGTRPSDIAVQVAERRGGHELQIERFRHTFPALVVHDDIAGFQFAAAGEVQTE